MTTYTLTESATLELVQGDITRETVDAIVNAANERMLGGAGVDGAIHRVAGPELLEECRTVAEVQPGIRCPRGEARATAGYGLACQWVIHTVGPIFSSLEESEPVLASAYRATLRLANERGARSIAFPAISCGVYGFPHEPAAAIAFEACRSYVGDIERVRFVLFDTDSHRRWLDVAHSHLAP